MPDRLDELGGMIAHGLRAMRTLPPESRESYAADVALVVKVWLGPKEREWLLSVAAKAAPDEALDRMAHDLIGVPPL